MTIQDRDRLARRYHNDSMFYNLVNAVCNSLSSGVTEQDWLDAIKLALEIEREKQDRG